MSQEKNNIKADSETAIYQKRITDTETVILCVSLAEEYVRGIGKDLVVESKGEDRPATCGKSGKFAWSYRYH
ncbi:hypothetical protein ACFL2Q_11630 [Thermodesulfobacteriota bacterium]